MRTLLVSSQLTYVPRNYLALFEGVLESASAHIAGLVLLENVSWRITKDIVGLKLLGCSGIAGNLSRNLLRLKLKERELLFEKAGIQVIQSPTMNSPEMLEYIRKNKIDLIVNARTRCIYKKPILEAPTLGCINVHHGLLPDYRGTLCDLYALFEGRPAGFTIHEMNEKIDAGKILKRCVVSSGEDRNFSDYLEKAAILEGKELALLLKDIDSRGALPDGLENRCEKATYSRNPDRKQIARMRQEGLLL